MTALPREQSRNKRDNHYIEIDGINLCVVEWCEFLGVPNWKPYEMIRKRGAQRNLPPAFNSIDDAMRELYRQHKIKREGA